MDTTVIDLAPLADIAIELLTAFLLGLGGAAVYRLTRFLKLEEDAKVRAYLQNAVYHAVDFAAGRARMRLAKYGALAIDARSEMVAHAVNYLVEQVPDALKHFGITPDGIKKLIEARLGEFEQSVPAEQPAPADEAPAANP